MLWSLIKIVLFVALVAALTLGAAYLLETDGGVMITVADTEYTLGPLQAVIAVLVLVLALWIVLKLLSLLVAILRFINGDETALSRWFDRNRERKGYRAISDGVLALAAGEGRTAMTLAARAQRYIDKPDLTNLITAQGAELAGDTARAEEAYKRLIRDERTRFVGIRGILRQKLAEGDTETALKLAQRAFELKPRHVETQDTLLRLQAETGDWTGARQTLSAKRKAGALPRDVHRRRDAVLALSEARGVLEEGASIEAREAAIEANTLSPDLIPAAAMAARGYIERGKPRYAARVLKKAWQAQPHPDLAAAFAEIAPEETPEARLKRFAALTRIHPDHRETRLLQAELYLAAEDFPAARRALGNLPETDPDARVLTMMAAIERGEGASDAVVKGWLARAVTAPRGPQWVCENCHNIQAQWAPVCDNCHAFDTLAWKRPPQSAMASPTGVEMLPLIVGAAEAPAPATPPAPRDAGAEVDEAEVIDPGAEPEPEMPHLAREPESDLPGPDPAPRK